MNGREQAMRLELQTIQPIARDARHGRARDLFTVWFGSNVHLLTIVTGALSVTVFGLPFIWAVAGLTVGTLVGAIFMALHAAQGPTLGVPQMMQTRGQFGSIGALLVVGIVIVMYVGFLSSNIVLGGEALASLAPGWSDMGSTTWNLFSNTMAACTDGSTVRQSRATCWARWCSCRSWLPPCIPVPQLAPWAASTCRGSSDWR